MDQNHPIPQHISSYQFRLVGDMTLKQFFQLAGGGLVSLLFYASPLHPLIKWPAILFFALLGAALAFLPLEERPLENWIIALFKSVYSPTIYSWRRPRTPPSFFQDEAAVPPETLATPYLSQTPTQRLGFLIKLEESENSFLSRFGQILSGMIGSVSPAPPVASPQTRPSPSFQAPPQPPPIKPRFVVEEKSAPVTSAVQTVQGETLLSPVAPTLTAKTVSFGKKAQFSLEAAPPNPPTIANVVVGQVLNANGEIIDGAIMEIKDASGRPVRALKSNKLGHFMIVTPLADGNYQIITEKEGFEFEPITFETAGSIIPPIEIRAKALINGQQSTVSSLPAQAGQQLQI